MKPRTKACKGEQLGDPLQGELATYDQVGLFQRSVNQKTAYRYRGALLQYQKALQGNRPTVELSKTFLALLREQNFSPSTLRVYRAALQGFHAWRGESLVFPVRVPYHAPPYIEASVVQSLLTRAKDRPRDYLILLLMAHAGLRRDETVNLRVGGVGERAPAVKATATGSCRCPDLGRGGTTFLCRQASRCAGVGRGGGG